MAPIASPNASPILMRTWLDFLELQAPESDKKLCVDLTLATENAGEATESTREAAFQDDGGGVARYAKLGVHG
jgi:hypothetical protein